MNILIIVFIFSSPRSGKDKVSLPGFVDTDDEEEGWLTPDNLKVGNPNPIIQHFHPPPPPPPPHVLMHFSYLVYITSTIRYNLVKY